MPGVGEAKTDPDQSHRILLGLLHGTHARPQELAVDAALMTQKLRFRTH